MDEDDFWHKTEAPEIERKAFTDAHHDFGLNLSEWEEVTSATHCAICGKEIQHRWKDTNLERSRSNVGCIDHDHATGKVREVLCNDCNRGLGSFKDNAKFMLSAINYLKRHKDEATN